MNRRRCYIDAECSRGLGRAQKPAEPDLIKFSWFSGRQWERRGTLPAESGMESRRPRRSRPHPADEAFLHTPAVPAASAASATFQGVSPAASWHSTSTARRAIRDGRSRMAVRRVVSQCEYGVSVGCMYEICTMYGLPRTPYRGALPSAGQGSVPARTSFDMDVSWLGLLPTRQQGLANRNLSLAATYSHGILNTRKASLVVVSGLNPPGPTPPVLVTSRRCRPLQQAVSCRLEAGEEGGVSRVG